MQVRLPFSQDFVNVVEKAGGLLFALDFHSATAGSWTDGLNTITWETMAVFNGPRDADNKFSIYPCT